MLAEIVWRALTSVGRQKPQHLTELRLPTLVLTRDKRVSYCVGYTAQPARPISDDLRIMAKPIVTTHCYAKLLTERSSEE